MYRGLANTTLPLNDIPLSAGINRTVPLMLNMSYTVPAFECWLALLVPVCYTREFTGANHMPIDALKYDVFPATLDGFIALTSSGDGGQRLAWDPAFRTLADADGDGLLASAKNGPDPNDAAVDADGDGLTDRYELEQRAAGVAFSPILRDTDSDGLTDLQETQLGTDPTVADSDNDGLKDGEEVRHLVYDANGKPTSTWAGGWSVTINASTPFTIFVSSNPFSGDSDDGISDQAERQLAADATPANRVDNQNRPYNPNVPNTPALAVFAQSSDFDGFVRPGQTVAYTTTVVANTAVAPGVLNVTAPAILGGSPNPFALPFDPLTFSTSQTVTQQTNVAVPSSATSQQARISSAASTRLPNTGTSGWAFAPVNPETGLGGITAPNAARFTDVTASRPDRQDSFLLAAVANNNVAGTFGRGDILAYSLPGGGARAIEDDANDT